MNEKFNMFMETVDERFRSFVNQINEHLTENDCKCDIKLQKSGYIVSYALNNSKRILATFVSRIDPFTKLPYSELAGNFVDYTKEQKKTCSKYN